MKPVDFVNNTVSIGDKVIFSEEVFEWLGDEMKDAVNRGIEIFVCGIEPDPFKFGTTSMVQVDVERRDTKAQQGFLLNPKTGQPTWVKGSWYVFYLPDNTKTVTKLNLKSLNTAPSAVNCASCGNKLKQPEGMDCKYKFCPTCEP